MASIALRTTRLSYGTEGGCGGSGGAGGAGAGRGRGSG